MIPYFDMPRLYLLYHWRKQLVGPADINSYPWSAARIAAAYSGNCK